MSTVAEQVQPDAASSSLVLAKRRQGLLFAATIFSSAFLLFEVQPLISKYILPWFGGSPAVWTTCMLFFQMVLFAGYAYADLVQRWLTPGRQAWAQMGLLTAAVLTLPIAPNAGWKPTDSAEPTGRILALLLVCVGLPYFVLSSTGPLVQAWFSRTYPGRSPYRLYALSNVGSLAALLSYPFYFEGAMNTAGQAWWWSGGFLIYAVLCACCALHMSRAARLTPVAAAVAHASSAQAAPDWRRRVLWIGLPALASVALLATTNHVCQDIAPVPLLWVVPLGLYLLSFIVSFDHARWYRRGVFAAAGAALLLLAGTWAYAASFIYTRFGWDVDLNFKQELVLYFAALFCLCMTCHGELVRLKPEPRYLTSFYLMIAAGGALGGIFVSLVAPQLFVTYFEWPLVLMAGYSLGIALLFGFEPEGDVAPADRPRGAGARTLALAVGLAGVGAIIYCDRDERPALAVTRNFYGVATVVERAANEPQEHDRALFNGNIEHGAQLQSAEGRRLPITYYDPSTGIGLTLDYLHRTRGSLRVATVGLGIGTLATYAQPGDRFTFYEINPDVERLARQYFSYLSDCHGEVAVELGDARISFERQEPQHFDLLVLDAFSGDAIPAHLLTAEAADIYRKHLRDDGVVVIHITNHYLDLAPVVLGLADRLGLKATGVFSERDDSRDLYRAHWVVLTKDAALVTLLESQPAARPLSTRRLLWTDDRSNLFEILR